jgi:hypothetical protein
VARHVSQLAIGQRPGGGQKDLPQPGEKPDRPHQHEEKERQAAQSAQRKSMVGSGERAEKIRTYNFPQNRVTDHRIGLTVHNLDAIMAGDLENVVEAIQDQAGKLLHGQVNIGVAVGTEEGLVVPVIHEADQLSLAEITSQLKALQEKASRMRFGANDLSGGTFTISNLGMFGIDHFHAIINPPESAILAVGRILKTPVGLPDESIALRPIMNMTLSIDHRSLDGMQGARFLALVKERLEQPYLIL